jgi:hypothetical protein
MRQLLVLGAKACMSLIPGTASLVNRVFTGFLSQLPRSRSDLHSPAIPTFERARMALQTLSEIVGDSSIAHRNPRSSLSFSCVTPEVAKSQLESLRFYSKDIDKTYCPLGRDGRPIRKYDKVLFRLKRTRFLHHAYRYSERKLAHHWFHGDNRGISHVGKCARRIYAANLCIFTDPEVLIAARQNIRPSSPVRPLDGSLTANGIDLVTEAVRQDGRMRRTTVNSTSVEKHILKGSMSKVVTQTTSLKGTPQGIPLTKNHV